MKISNCKNCIYYERRTWKQYYKPTNYHAIGFIHAYGFCIKNQKRCSQIKKCERVNSDKIIITT